MYKYFPDITAVVLAAGSSVRMGQPKALLRVEGDVFVTRILKNLAEFGLSDIILVLGEHAPRVEPVLTDQVPVQIIVNPDPTQGQLSSLKLALDYIDKKIKGIILVLVDHPLVQKETYRKILDEAENEPERIIIPSYNGKNGHPVYFGKKYFKSLRETPLDQGAKAVVYQNRSDVITIPVGDSGILKDIDDPDNYRKFIAGD